MNYTKKILLIYLTKVVGLLTGLASVFLVVPALASNPAIFGIFTICINLNIFFTYADLGFISAGQKYAAEFFALGDKNRELEVIGFVIFLLSIFVTLISLVILMIAYNPQWLVKNGNETELAISTKLLMILAFFAPTILLQRFNAIIYSVRLDDYIYQLIEIVANICKICSIGFFVTKHNYDIVAYFFTIQALSIVSASIAMMIAVRRYNFSFRDIFKHYRFSKDIYYKTKSLAISSLLLTVSWILYFEIDSVLLSKLYGLKAVAIYAIAFTFLSFSRNLYNTLYSPFQTRFNHFVGLGEDKNLLNFLDFVIKITFPLCIIPPLVLILYMKMIIISWVGLDYLSSLLISRLFILVTALLAITIPLSYVIIAKSQNRILRMSALILPLIFYIALFIFDKVIGLNSLAFAKLITVIFGCSITFYGLYRIIGRRIIVTYWHCFIKSIFPIIILSIFYFLFPPVTNFIPKSTNAFLQLFIHIVPAILFPLLAYYLSEKQIVSFLRDKLNIKVKLKSI